MKLFTHSIGTGANIMFFKTSDCYSNIAAKTGVSKVTDSEGDEVLVSVKELLRTGHLIRVRISYDSAGKTRTASLLVARTKLFALLGDEESGQIQGSNYIVGTSVKGIIKRLYLKRNASFY